MLMACVVKIIYAVNESVESSHSLLVLYTLSRELSMFRFKCEGLETRYSR